ncbi:hypothetical protein EON67_05190 [archaeon]|nr:MAG: hypothetical protein EON67_05190 [archaeon]
MKVLRKCGCDRPAAVCYLNACVCVCVCVRTCCSLTTDDVIEELLRYLVVAHDEANEDEAYRYVCAARAHRWCAAVRKVSVGGQSPTPFTHRAHTRTPTRVRHVQIPVHGYRDFGVRRAATAGCGRLT